MADIAVIGAGLAGLVAASKLSSRHTVTVFEKSAGFGGRMATRYAGDYVFDHGTQFFTANTPAFQQFLQPMIAAGVVAGWPARVARIVRTKIVDTRRWGSQPAHFVGTPHMTSPARWLAEQLDVRLQVTVARVEQRNSDWHLVDDSGTELGRFDWVVFTAPAPQTDRLLPDDCSIRQYSRNAVMLGCYTLMLADERPLHLSWDAALVQDAVINWIAVNSSKPGRSGQYCIVAHSRNDWADAHMDDDPESVMACLLDECSVVLGVDAGSASHRRLHRWRYANMDQRETPGYGIDTRLKLAACGDWFIRGRVEGAFTSALRLTEALDKHI